MSTTASKIETGGAAFPNPGRMIQNPFSHFPHAINEGSAPGMTLRDYFIAHIGDDNQSGDQGDYDNVVKAALVNRRAPNPATDGWLAVLQFEADFRAAWRVMRAEAMLKARVS